MEKREITVYTHIANNGAYSCFDYQGSSYRIYFNANSEKFIGILESYDYTILNFVHDGKEHLILGKIEDKVDKDNKAKKYTASTEEFTMDVYLLLWFMCEGLIVVNKIS